MAIKRSGFKSFTIGLLVAGILWLSPSVARGSEETEVRAVVQQVFQQLKSRDYGGVYDYLPSTTRNRMSRERFVNALKRAQDRYELEASGIALALPQYLDYRCVGGTPEKQCRFPHPIITGGIGPLGGPDDRTAPRRGCPRSRCGPARVSGTPACGLTGQWRPGPSSVP